MSHFIPWSCPLVFCVGGCRGVSLAVEGDFPYLNRRWPVSIGFRNNKVIEDHFPISPNQVTQARKKKKLADSTLLLSKIVGPDWLSSTLFEKLDGAQVRILPNEGEIKDVTCFGEAPASAVDAPADQHHIGEGAQISKAVFCGNTIDVGHGACVEQLSLIQENVKVGVEALIEESCFVGRNVVVEGGGCLARGSFVLSSSTIPCLGDDELDRFSVILDSAPDAKKRGVVVSNFSSVAVLDSAFYTGLKTVVAFETTGDLPKDEEDEDGAEQPQLVDPAKVWIECANTLKKDSVDDAEEVQQTENLKRGLLEGSEDVCQENLTEVSDLFTREVRFLVRQFWDDHKDSTEELTQDDFGAQLLDIKNARMSMHRSVADLGRNFHNGCRVVLRIVTR